MTPQTARLETMLDESLRRPSARRLALRKRKLMTEPEMTASTLIALGTATLAESGAAIMAPRLRAVWPGARLAAPAFPVHCTAGDNLAVHVAVSLAPSGSALVVDVGGEPERGYFGEVLATAALARRLTGLVIDGGVRDTEALEAHGFPVFATTVALRGATKQEPGSAGLTVEVAGTAVAAGDWVVADADGVVVIAQRELTEVLARAEARSAKEQTLFDAIRRGSTTLDLLELDPGPVRTPS